MGLLKGSIGAALAREKALEHKKLLLALVDALFVLSVDHPPLQVLLAREGDPPGVYFERARMWANLNSRPAMQLEAIGWDQPSDNDF